MQSMFLKYYRDTFLYNIVFSIFIGIASNFFICFLTFGSLVSFIAYQYHKGHEYYFYLNYGYTKLELMTKAYLFNILFSFFLYILVLCFTWTFKA